MALPDLPYIYEENFELGTRGQFDVTGDTDSQIDFPHFTTLSRFKGHGPAHGYAPYNGAYCMRIRLGIGSGTNPATLEEADVNIAASPITNSLLFNILFCSDLQATSADAVSILKLEQTDDTAEVVYGFDIATDGGITMGVGETDMTTQNGALAILRDQWYTCELTVTNGAGADGIIDTFVTRWGTAASTVGDTTQITGLTQGAIGQATFGIEDQLGTTTGTILLDTLMQDDLRIFPRSRFGSVRRMTQRGHAVVGGGTIDDVVAVADGTNAMEVNIYDTNNAYILGDPVATVSVDAGLVQERLGHPITIQRGAFVEFTGTSHYAEVHLGSGFPRSEVDVIKLGRSETEGLGLFK